MSSESFQRGKLLRAKQYFMRDEYDFSQSKPASEVPHLAKLQAQGGKTRITMYVDDDVLAAFRAQAEQQGIGYQTAINQVLRDYLQQGESTLESVLRKVIREELQVHHQG